MTHPSGPLFHPEHTWLAPSPDGAADEMRVGITEHAQSVLGDIVFVQLPEPGSSVQQGQVAGVVESVKTAADLYAPASGQVTAINPALQADPSLANTAPLSAGWLFALRPSNPAELAALMDSAAYARHIGQS